MFEFVFISREAMEVATQAYQVYKCSTLISQSWINNFYYVAVLATNCWITPLIHVAARRDAAAQRFLFLWSDTTLDLISTLVIPVCIIYSSLFVTLHDGLQSEVTDAEYAFDMPYSDTFLMNLFKGVQQICVVDWWDFLTKMLPFMSMANCLHYIRRMIEPTSGITSQALVVKHNQVGAVPSSTDAIKEIEASTPEAATKRPLWRMRWIISTHIIYVVFFVWGATIVGLHFQADFVSRSTPPEIKAGCKSSSTPWFVGKFSCTVLEINCYRRGFTGEGVEIAAALDHMDPNGVSSLIISHCPQLSIPRRIQTLRNLMGFEIVNSTIVQWGEDAALTRAATPAMLFMTLARVNLTELPKGLQSDDFPPHLADVAISVSNLTTLPDYIDTKWTPVISLVLERSDIATAPACIGKLRLYRLSLLGNSITSISDSVLAAADRLAVVSVAKNPITHFPRISSENAQTLNMIILDYTSIATLPDWVLTEGQRRASSKQAPLTVSAGGSTFCNNANTSGPPPPGLTVVCRLKSDEAIQGFPLAFNMAHRIP